MVLDNKQINKLLTIISSSKGKEYRKLLFKLSVAKYFAFIDVEDILAVCPESIKSYVTSILEGFELKQQADNNKQ